MLLTDGSFQLLDKYGNEIGFDSTGKFEAMAAFREQHPVIKAISHGDYVVNFEYGLSPQGEVTIAKAVLGKGGENAKMLYAVDYQYDREGRLAKVQKTDAANQAQAANTTNMRMSALSINPATSAPYQQGEKQ